MKSLAEIEVDVSALASRIGVSATVLPGYGASRDFGNSHVEIDLDLYHYIVVERGKELLRRSSPDYEDLLYWIFRDITHELAFAWELKYRVEDRDCRRMAFPKQIELMQLLSPAMGQRLEIEIADILRRAPYNDEPTIALNRTRGNRVC